VKALKNIAKGLFYAFMVIYYLVCLIIFFVEIFESQGFMAILWFVASLLSLATSLSFAWVIGKYLNKDDDKVMKCKDCTEWDEKECECYHWHGFKENDYCSHGIRKGAE
jgi:hypothetical protein